MRARSRCREHRFAEELLSFCCQMHLKAVPWGGFFFGRRAAFSGLLKVEPLECARLEILKGKEPMKRFTALTMSVAALVLGICGWRAIASASSVASASTSVHQEEELLVQDSLAVSAVPDASTEIMAVRGFFASMEGDAQAIAAVLATVPEDESTVVFPWRTLTRLPLFPLRSSRPLKRPWRPLTCRHRFCW